jgi:type VI secretion system protein ImpL
MKRKLILLLAVAMAIIFLLLAWFVPAGLHLQGSNLWILRAGLLVLGLILCVALVLWAVSKDADPKVLEAVAKAGPGVPSVSAFPVPAVDGLKTPAMAPLKLPASQGADEIDVLAHEAEARLQASELGRSASLRKLPLILVVGLPGSGKTTTVLDSGLDPELLAGEVTQAGALVPTRSVNFWFARKMLFVEAGGPLAAAADRWVRLVRRLVPARLMPVLGGQGQAARGVLVCVSCEDFVKPGAAEALAGVASGLATRLREAAQVLSVSFPVYVLFTKLDSLRFFGDYAANLSAEEAVAVLGSTLSRRPESRVGVYAEEESKRLAAAFDSLYLSLCARRPELLRQEYDAAKLPGIYEFPREFRKLRNTLVEFLVDLCRPSQLRSGPFLRGFYFAGSRTVMASEPAPSAALAPAAEETDATLGATRVFNFGRQQVPPLAEAATEGGVTKVFDVRSLSGQGTGAGARQPSSRSRAVRQPVFLPHVFSAVLLEDRAALGASSQSAKVSLWRRGLVAAACLGLLVWCAGLTVSYFGNRRIESAIQVSAATIPAAQLGAGQFASLDTLKQLNHLREAVAELEGFEQNGVPWRLRWGIYPGHELYPAARALYFNRFYALLFAQTQSTLLGRLRGLPPAPSAGADYKSAYEDLKAYLITTSHHEKSTLEFLPAILTSTWAAGRGIDPQTRDLVQKQFTFYSAELKSENPYSSIADQAAVSRAREYLSHFAGVERVYQAMLAAAAKNKPVNFNRDFPGSAETVLNQMEISGAFTKSGWATMQQALLNPDQYFHGEDWVLGPQAAASVAGGNLQQTLSARYKADYISEWRNFLKNTAVVRYASLADASHKLDALSGNKSPILELFWLVSQNTSVDPDVAKAFQPAQSVVPPSLENQYVGAPNKPYVDALLNLKTSVDQSTQGPGASLDAAASQIYSSAASARTVTEQIAQTFAPDPAAHVDDTVKRLMLAPILNAQAVIPTPGQALNGKGPSFCAAFTSLDRKYPFNPRSTTPATLEDLNAIYQPVTGSLWAFYNTNLKVLLVQQGTAFAAQPGGAVKLNPEFVRFFSSEAAISRALYPGNASAPHLAYTLTAYPVEEIQAVTVTIEGQTLTASGATPQSKQFVWPGPGPAGVTVSGNVGGTQLNFLNLQGPWAVFEFFRSAERSQPAAGGAIYEWIPKTGGQPITLSGRAVTLRFGLNMAGAPPIFQKGYLASLGCVSKIVL